MASRVPTPPKLGPLPEFITRPAPAMPSAWAGLSRPLPPEPMTTSTARRVDWSAPHWEAVAAEQPLIAPTLLKRNADRTIRIARSPHGGRRRLKHPETGAGLLTDGDVGQFGPHKVLRLFFGRSWHVIPSHEQLLRWTLDGMADTPDGRTVEPDDSDSWLVLLDLV